jgi:LemA protein
VRDLNDAVQRFPDLLVARLGSFSLAGFFQSRDEQRAPAKVELAP